jgi:hypothetical protein
MKRNKEEEKVDITGRLRQIEQLEMPKVASPRLPVEDDEPHLRPVTLLQQRSSRRD